MNINLELYRYFYVVANNKNMTKASEELHISQPALSQSIKKLESQLNCTLFFRNNKGMQLTKEGESLFDYIKGAMTQITNAENELLSFKELDKGEIRIGASTTITKTYLIDSIKRFHQDYPNIKINIINDLTTNLILDLEKGKLDYVIYNDDISNNQNINSKILLKVKQGFIYNPNNYKDIKDLKDLNNYPLILQKKESNSRKFLDTYCTNNNILLNPSIEVVSQELIIELTNASLGIGFTNLDIAKNKYPNLKELSINKNIPNTNIYIATNNNIKLNIASKKYLDYL